MPVLAIFASFCARHLRQNPSSQFLAVRKRLSRTSLDCQKPDSATYTAVFRCHARDAHTALPRVGSRTRRHPQADRRVIARKSGVRCAREPLANAGGSFRNETSGAKKAKCFTLGLKGGAFRFSCSLRIWKDSSKKVSIFGTWQLTLGIFTLVADSKKLLLGGYDKGEGE